MRNKYFMAISLIAFAGVFVMTSCHKDKLSKPKVDPLSLINGTIGASTKVDIDYSQSVSNMAVGAAMEDYSQGIFKATKTGTATLSCAVVSFDRPIPIDTVKLWMSYKNIVAATSQQIAAYGANEAGLVALAPSNTIPIVAVGDSAHLNGVENYLVFGDANGDGVWDLSLITAAGITTTTAVSYLVVE